MASQKVEADAHASASGSCLCIRVVLQVLVDCQLVKADVVLEGHERHGWGASLIRSAGLSAQSCGFAAACSRARLKADVTDRWVLVL